ncbi:MAG: undecaprenyl-phosphate glucose phosphotransferase [Chitinophagales bacterium]|nr:MAG: undecaprenyl-phosphate glucose phosphotransferase [Chitinophagales bacterium]
MNRKTAGFFYVLSDYLAAMLAWGLMFIFRKTYIGGYSLVHNPEIVFDRNFYFGIFFIPLFWIMVYFITGTYREYFRKSRLTELFRTFLISFFGVLILFFVFILDDQIDNDYKNYYRTLLVLFSLHFTLTFLGRLLILNRIKSLVRRGIIGYNTVVIGGNENAVQLYHEISDPRKALGYRLVGFIDTNGESTNQLKAYMPELGKLSDLEKIAAQDNIEEVIIAIESSEHHRLNSIINSLADKNVIIKIIPDMYDILSGSVKMENVIGAPLIEIYPDIMPFWQKLVKRLIDILFSVIALVALSPLMAFIALRVKYSSPGPILFRQERIGQHGKPFTIYKFRSMYVNAEENGPQLSSKNDPRITSWGRVMRKWRIDELPQFYNILKGDMSLVGPRPERKYYIDQLVKIAPAYKHLQKVKPGITSWGMVKYGYAENLNQMVERLKWDLLYIENMSLSIDFKIMIYTVLVILQGRGK